MRGADRYANTDANAACSFCLGHPTESELLEQGRMHR